MRRARIMIALTTVATAMLVVAPSAPARDDAGQGWYGQQTDPVITHTMFIVIAFFPVFILVASVIQARLDKRKHAREDAVRAREGNADWRGGW
jgi:hypothetical protein